MRPQDERAAITGGTGSLSEFTSRLADPTPHPRLDGAPDTGNADADTVVLRPVVGPAGCGSPSDFPD